MGSQISSAMGYTDTTPDFYNKPTHDPLYGFENGRKLRGNILIFFLKSNILSE